MQNLHNQNPIDNPDSIDTPPW